jgi:FADH2 O2-dependent halogenase
MPDLVPGLPVGPYPDDWAAVHHLIDEGWMYALRFDDGVTSAGFALSPPGLAGLGADGAPDADGLWQALLDRYPTLRAAFGQATPLMPLAFRSGIQHRLTRAAGERWALLPHTYAFVDPLFSTGIAWSLRAIERLALCFGGADGGPRLPSGEDLSRYEGLLSAEADQIDRLVAGSYEAMAHFDLFAAHAMIYFAIVSFAETWQRVVPPDGEGGAWSGFLGVGDSALGPLPGEGYRRVRRITGSRADAGTARQRRAFASWVARAIAPRNIGGFADPSRHNLYPLDLDVLVHRHAVLGCWA